MGSASERSSGASLEVRGLCKSYPGVQALEDVRLDVMPGEVMALLGENGAGKSTFVKLLTGVETADAGTVRLAGRTVSLQSPADAQALGIVAIHQEPTMFDDLSVVENLYIDRLTVRKPLPLLDWPGMKREARALLAQLNLDVDVDGRLGDLNLAQKHLVSVAKALSRDARVLILDEPTAALSSQEIDELFAIVRDLRSRGKAIVFISHKFDEIFAIADRYTVLRDGGFVGTGSITDVTKARLIELMVGRSLDEVFPKVSVEIGAPVLRVEALAHEREFEGVTFTLNRSEILGFYGLVGAGRSEVMQAIYGLRSRPGGTITLDGSRYVPSSPAAAIAKGIYYVSEDRQRDGVFLSMPIRDNVTLPILDRLATLIFRRAGREFETTRALGERLEVKASSWMQDVGELSGGNQQKVAIGMGLGTGPKVVILDEPTRGIDIGSKAAVHAFVGELVKAGLSVILVSSELEEVLGISDRVVVMHRGRVRGTHRVGEIARERVLAEASGL